MQSSKPIPEAIPKGLMSVSLVAIHPPFAVDCGQYSLSLSPKNRYYSSKVMTGISTQQISHFSLQVSLLQTLHWTLIFNTLIYKYSETLLKYFSFLLNE